MQQFRDLFDANPTDSLSSLREKAWERFLHLGLPYTGNFRPPEPAAIKQGVERGLTLVNGCFVPGLSKPPSGVVVTPLHEAMHTYGTFLKTRILEGIRGEKNAFAVLNAAIHQNGLFVYLPPNTQTEFEILHVITGEMIATPRIHFFAGKGAEAKISLRHEGEEGLVNQVIDCALEEGARLTISGQYTGHDTVRATVKRDGFFKAVVLGEARSDYHVKLLGEGAETRLYGGARVDKLAEAKILVEHIAPHTLSTQLFKYVVTGKSRFEGKIYVHKEAQKTDAFQMNNNLLLTDDAKAESKPNLEIFADDVKASHGSTTGQFDEESLFYLRSRGLSETQAKEMLIAAFLQPVIDES